MSKPRLLDLFCKAGGAGMGYHHAGFEVVGVDIEAQPRYPFEFIQADALEYVREYGHEFDAIHASPPCQRSSTMTKRWGQKRVDGHPNLIPELREALDLMSKPHIMENVMGAPLHLNKSVMLCGTMFDGLKSQGYELQRHRLFECSWGLIFPPASCCHTAQALPVYGHAGGTSKRDGLKFPGTDAWREGMGIDWMTGNELAEAIPPAYTEYIGKFLMEAVFAPEPRP